MVRKTYKTFVYIVMKEPGEEIIFLAITHPHACVQNKATQLRKSASFQCFSLICCPIKTHEFPHFQYNQ